MDGKIKDALNKSDAVHLGGVFIVVLLAVGAPVALGLSWLPLPHGPYSPLMERTALGWWPAFKSSVDSFSFAHFDWPARAFAKAAEAMDSSPYWNPHVGLGLPMIGQYQTEMLFPLEVLERQLGMLGWNIVLVAKVLLAATGAYVLSSYVTADRVGRATAGVAYALSAYFIWFTSIPPFVNGAMMVPWVFIAVTRLPSTHLSFPSRAGFLAIVGGLALLTGQPQITIVLFVCASILLVALVTAANAWRRSASTLAAFALGLLGATIIALPQLLQFLVMYKWGYSLHSPGAYAAAGTSILNLTNPLWPYLLGQLMGPWAGELYPGDLNWEGFPFVLGASLLLFSLEGIRFISREMFREDRARAGVAAAIVATGGGVLLVVLVGTLGFTVWRLPLLDRVNLPRYGAPILALSVAIAAACSVTSIRSIGGRSPVPRVAFLIIVATAALLVAVRVADVRVLPELHEYARDSVILGVVSFSMSCVGALALMVRGATAETARRQRIGMALLVSGELAGLVRYGFPVQIEFVRLFAFAFVIAGVVLIRRHLYAGMALAVVPLVVPLILLVISDQKLPRQIQDIYASPAEYLVELKKMVGDGSREGRVLAGDATSWPNVTASFGISQLQSLAPIQVAVTANLMLNELSVRRPQYALPTQWLSMSDQFGGTSLAWSDYLERRDAYNVLAVKFLLDPPGGPLSLMSIDDIHRRHASNVAIYEDSRALPRAYALPVETNPSQFAERQAVGERKAEFLPSLKDLIAHVAKHRDRLTEVKIERLKPDFIELKVGVSQPSVAVLADAYFPGWSATVDGEPRQLLRVGGALRGVLVRPGEAIVQMKYAPPYWKPTVALAILVAVVSGLGCLGGVLRALTLRRRASAES